MKYLKTYKLFENIEVKKPMLYRQILAELGYYSNEREELKIIADKIFKNNEKLFPNSVINNMDYLSENADDSKKLVYHSTYYNFDIFKTPSFFGAADGYKTDDSITYNCILNITNPLDLRHKNDNWFDLLKDIFKDDKDCERRIEFAKQYGDAYGFFKLLFNADDHWGVYRWDLIYNYLNKHGYDGAIYRESDSSIRWYFDGFLVLKPSQIKILFKWDNSEKKIVA
jgi:hypothetical protein